MDGRIIVGGLYPDVEVDAAVFGHAALQRDLTAHGAILHDLKLAGCAFHATRNVDGGVVFLTPTDVADLRSTFVEDLRGDERHWPRRAVDVPGHDEDRVRAIGEREDMKLIVSRFKVYDDLFLVEGDVHQRH